MNEKLKESPMFNLSLSSKELFHSNFIDWLTNKYPEKISKVFSNLLNKEIKIKESLREKNNFDLKFQCQEKDIVIENKFKSIIKKDQLEKYNKKLNDEIRILLTLHKTNYEEKICKEVNWKLINYKEFIEELENLELENYHNEILKDYCYFIKEINNMFSDKNYLEYTIKDMINEYNELKDIRLHDIQQKIMFNEFLVYLEDKLEKNNDNIFVIDGFTHSTGIVTYNYTIDIENDFRLEIQFQFDRLKFMIINNDPLSKNLKEFRNIFFNIIETFSKSKYVKENKLYPNITEKNQGFNKYGNRIKYKNVIINEDIKFKEILDKMYNLFKEVIVIGEEYRDGI